MTTRFLIDSDVIIEYLRGSEQAIRYLESLEGGLCVSAITVAELYSGVRGSDEEAALERLLGAEELPAGLRHRPGRCARGAVGGVRGSGTGDVQQAALSDGRRSCGSVSS